MLLILISFAWLLTHVKIGIQWVEIFFKRSLLNTDTTAGYYFFSLKHNFLIKDYDLFHASYACRSNYVLQTVLRFAGGSIDERVYTGLPNCSGLNPDKQRLLSSNLWPV
jgi:hypothetical protein